MFVNRELEIDVLTAARERIINVFKNGVPVYMSFSGGKDSIVLGDIVYNLIIEGKIDPSLLTVRFIDEECMYDSCIEIVKKWRQKFMLAGVKFDWFCLEVLHFNCLNQLADEETYVIWDRYKKDVWVRPMPPFAITSHPLFEPRKETYQKFLTKVGMDGLTLVGLRMAESMQRRQVVAKAMAGNKDHLPSTGNIYPLYDWKDDDVWFYILKNNIEIPDVYQNMYQAGVSRRNLRISQFFAIDTVRSLYKMAEFYPDLMERLTRREPNAYMVALYFDTEMFGRKTKKRKDIEQAEEQKDYKKLTLEIFKDPTIVLSSKNFRRIVNTYKTLYLRYGHSFTDEYWKMFYEKLITGDAKLRGYRAIASKVIADEVRRQEEGK